MFMKLLFYIYWLCYQVNADLIVSFGSNQICSQKWNGDCQTLGEGRKKELLFNQYEVSISEDKVIE